MSNNHLVNGLMVMKIVLYCHCERAYASAAISERRGSLTALGLLRPSAEGLAMTDVSILLLGLDEFLKV